MNQLKCIREKKGMTILELSRKTSISERYLRFIENGEKTPSLKTAYAISCALEEPINEIFFDKK